MEFFLWLIVLACGAAIAFFGMYVITFPIIAIGEFICRKRKEHDPNYTSQLFKPASNEELKDDAKRFVISIIIVVIAYVGIYASTNGMKTVSEERTESDHTFTSEEFSTDSNSSGSDKDPIPHIEREPYYVLNTSTGKYHRPACGIGGRIAESNRKISYDSSEEIAARGYSPCGKCCP